MIRQPAVAGTFYPHDAAALLRAVESQLAEAEQRAGEDAAALRPRALIVPHAGFVYSGPVAASAYVLLRPLADSIERVVLLGPSHRVFVEGLATSSAECFVTPLGEIPLDRAAIDRALALPQTCVLDEAHAHEHSLEVQLPFLQAVLGSFALVPFAVGDASTDDVRAVLALFFDDPGTMTVISSDLSHFYDYATARRLDAETTRVIESLQPERLDHDSACGRVPVRGMLALAKQHGLRARTLDVRNSGDTAGPRDEVVGYGAWAFV
jgi:AmmeMemoRadiSam system protein B